MTLDSVKQVSVEDLEKIHKATLLVLEKEGVEFLSDKAIEIFKKNDFKVEGQTVYFTDEQIQKALSTCPKSFTLHARNPEKNVVIGENKPACSPIYGAPYVIDFDGEYRRSLLSDYHNLVKLSHMLPSQSVTGFILCDPSDVPPENAHKHMLHAALTLSDRPFMGCSTQGTQGVEDMMQMAEIAFDKDRDYLKKHTFSLSLINSLTPLRYETHAVEALMELAVNNQAILVAALVTGGATGPITLAGTLVIQNAEILAGIVLAQLVNAGTPIVYGCASGIMDMHTVATTLGAPEFTKIMTAAVPLAHWYGLPCRGGGGLTESCDVDVQAGYESMSSLMTAVTLGVDFVQHSIGTLASYMGSSYVKFVADDAMYMHALEARKPLDFSDTERGFALDVIFDVGKGGEFLTHDHTAALCREVFQSDIAFQKGLENWYAMGRPCIKKTCKERGLKLLEEYKTPELCEKIKAKIDAFVQN